MVSKSKSRMEMPSCTHRSKKSGVVIGRSVARSFLASTSYASNTYSLLEDTKMSILSNAFLRKSCAVFIPSSSCIMISRKIISKLSSASSSSLPLWNYRMMHGIFISSIISLILLAMLQHSITSSSHTAIESILSPALYRCIVYIGKNGHKVLFVP